MGISRDIETSQSPPEETAIQFVGKNTFLNSPEYLIVTIVKSEYQK